MKIYFVKWKEFNRFTPNNITEKMLLLNTENTNILINQTKLKPQETLENEMKKSLKTFSFGTLLESEEEWLLEITNLEV